MWLGERIKRRIILEHKLALIRFNSTKKLFNANDSLIICGDPRGGTTWLAETLAEIPETALLWEPLHLSYANQFEGIGFGWRQYIEAESEWPQAKHAFLEVLQGKVLNEWTLLKTNSTKFKNASQLLVKFCRANALLPWLCNTFDFKYKPVYLVRHPFAVVASQLKHEGWNSNFSGFQVEKGFFSEHYLKHEKFLKKIKTKEEALTANWCLSNKLNLSVAPENQKWIQVTYEEMVLEPQLTVAQILREWDKPFLNEIKEKLTQTSSTTLTGSPIHDKRKQLAHWQSSLSDKEVERMQRVLEYFEISLYTSDILPRNLNVKR